MKIPISNSTNTNTNTNINNDSNIIEGDKSKQSKTTDITESDIVYLTDSNPISPISSLENISNNNNYNYNNNPDTNPDIDTDTDIPIETMALDEILCSCSKENWLNILKNDTKNLEKFDFWDYASIPAIIIEEERAQELIGITQYSQGQSPIFSSNRKYDIF